jgi:mono/diheme cytochrome c family protein
MGAGTALLGLSSLWGCGGGDSSNNSSGLPGSTPTRAQVLRGRYIVTAIGGCGDCHSGGSENLNSNTWLSGYHTGAQTGSFPIGPFTTYAANITQDKTTGIGNWTSQQIFNAFRTGKDPEGKFLAPPMPWPVFRNMTDDDTWSLVAYLQSLKPTVNAVPESQGPPGAGGTPDWSGTYAGLTPLASYPATTENNVP